MSELLLRNITQGSAKSFLKNYIKVVGFKDPKVLDSVIPDVTKNLSQSTEAFLDALISQDSEFIQETSTVSLQRVLVPEIDKLKQAKIEIRQIPFKGKIQKLMEKAKTEENIDEDLKRLIISPYVIFGQTMEDRFKDELPWKNLYRMLSFNRFLYVNPREGFNWRKVKDHQVYGFHCHYTNFSKAIQIVKGNTPEEFEPREFVVSFETDASNHEFFVSDFNHLVRDSYQ